MKTIFIFTLAIVMTIFLAMATTASTTAHVSSSPIITEMNPITTSSPLIYFSGEIDVELFDDEYFLDLNLDFQGVKFSDEIIIETITKYAYPIFNGTLTYGKNYTIGPNQLKANIQWGVLDNPELTGPIRSRSFIFYGKPQSINRSGMTIAESSSFSIGDKIQYFYPTTSPMEKSFGVLKTAFQDFPEAPTKQHKKIAFKLTTVSVPAGLGEYAMAPTFLDEFGAVTFETAEGYGQCVVNNELIDVVFEHDSLTFPTLRFTSGQNVWVECDPKVAVARVVEGRSLINLAFVDQGEQMYLAQTFTDKE